MELVEQNNGKKLEWSIHNIEAEFALSMAALALISLILGTKKKEELVEMSESEIYQLVMDAKARYETDSEFERAVRLATKMSSTLSRGIEALRGDLIAREITVEDINNLGDANATRTKI